MVRAKFFGKGRQLFLLPFLTKTHVRANKCNLIQFGWLAAHSNATEEGNLISQELPKQKRKNKVTEFHKTERFDIVDSAGIISGVSSTKRTALLSIVRYSNSKDYAVWVVGYP